MLLSFSFLVVLHIGHRLFLSFFHLVGAVALVVSWVWGHGRQALIPSHMIVLFVGSALPARHRSPLIVGFRKLLRNTLQLARRNTNGTQHICLG